MTDVAEGRSGYIRDVYRGQCGCLWGGGGEGLRAEGRVEKGGGPRYGWSGQNPGFGFCALTRALVWSMSSPGKGHYRAAWFGGQSMGFGQLDFKTWSLLKCVLGHAH